MTTSLRKSLNLDMPALAEMLRQQGRGKDTVLAHITPKEAALLKSRGGRGSKNPKTGLLEFENEFDTGGFDTSGYTDTGSVQTPAQAFGGQDYNSYFDSGASSAANAGETAGTAVDTPSSLALDRSAQIAEQSGTGGFDVTGYTPSGAAQTPAQAAPGYDYQAQGVSPQTGAADTGGSNWLKSITDALSGAGGLAKLAGLAGATALGASTGTKATQQGQAAADQIAALAPGVQQRAANAVSQMTNPVTGLSTQAQNYGQQAVNQIGQVIPQLQQVGQNIAAFGAPLLTSGQQQMDQALGGTLTPAGQRQLEAVKAQAEQNIAARGGVGAMQAGRAEQEALANIEQQQYQQGQQTYQAGAAYGVQGQSLMAQAAQLGLTQAQVELAQNNLAGQIQQQAINLSLAQAGISDQYLIQSIQLGLQSDQQTAANLQNLYAKMSQIAFSQPTVPGQSIQNLTNVATAP